MGRLREENCLGYVLERPLTFFDGSPFERLCTTGIAEVCGDLGGVADCLLVCSTRSDGTNLRV